MKLLTVDPGMATGWAIWEGPNPRKPSIYGQIRVAHSNLETDLSELFKRFTEIQICERVCIEYPGIWQHSATSMVAAFSGDLIKLATIVGGFAAIAKRSDAILTLLPPQRWKGQLSKDAIKMRVKRATGIDERSSHINDAIGIGLYLLGLLSVPNIGRPFT